ncbi:MAG: UvrB/UvrC motif-containing protein, partial [Oscillospiraceae bacterium]
VRDILEISSKDSKSKSKRGKKLSNKEKISLIEKYTLEMKNAVKLLEFEHAAYLRDKINALKEEK